MSFEVDRYSSAWAHVALCADLTWAAQPPDEFIIANQRLWAKHCRVSQVQDQAIESQSLQTNKQCEGTEKRSSSSQIQENGSCSGQINAKDVIPESRLAQFYGNFYYDEVRFSHRLLFDNKIIKEKCYTNANEKSNGRGYNGQGCENSDLTECWMLPEVEYWFRKLVEEPSERNLYPRRRRQYRMLADDDLSSERWDLAGARAADEEATLAARVLSVRPLWGSPPRPGASAAGATRADPHQPRAHSPPPLPRKIRARRRQPRRAAALAPPPPSYCLGAPAQLFCDPTCKFQFDPPRPPQLTGCQRAMGRLSGGVQAVMRASAARCPPYRGTNVSRYAPTVQRPARGPDRRYGVWWPWDPPSPRIDRRLHLAHVPQPSADMQKAAAKTEAVETKTQEAPDESCSTSDENTASTCEPQPQQTTEKLESPTPAQKKKVTVDCQLPSTSAAAIEAGLRNKRLYSTVLSMSAPSAINLTPVGCVRLSQKMITPGLLKLNPKIVLPTARMRPPNVNNKFEELEKEALEQYKASDESIDTKLRDLEKQAVDQYSTSNSNTSCSSGNSAEKRASSSPLVPDIDPKNRKQAENFHKEKAVDSVVIYSQNFPDLSAKGHTASVTNLKNFHTPPRGEKKEQTHRLNKTLRSLKNESQRAASDTDYDSRETRNHRAPTRWTLHVMPPKKRHLTLCVADFSSDEEMEDASRSMKNASPCIKNHVAGKMKLSAHGGGDLHPILRKT